MKTFKTIINLLTAVFNLALVIYLFKKIKEDIIQDENLYIK